MILKTAAALVFAAALAGTASAQTAAPADKPTVGKYLADGYTVLRADIGSFPAIHPAEIDRIGSGFGLVLGSGADRRNVELPHHQVRR
jgi:hypothetical protein